MRATDDLVKAVCTGDSELVLSAIRRGANVNTRHRGRTVLLWAIQEGHLNVIKVLIRAGASLERRDDMGFTPLDQAVGGGRLSIVKFLLEAGAKVNGRTRNGSSLHTACAYRRIAIVKLLLAHGASPTALDEDGRMPEAFTRGGNKSKGDKALQKILAQYDAS